MDDRFPIPQSTRKPPRIACRELGFSLVITSGSDEDACKVVSQSLSFVRMFSFSHDQILSFRIPSSVGLGPKFHDSLQKDQEGAHSLPIIGAVLLQMHKETISVNAQKH